jgi:Mrp family chromosome partitioning ATPase
LLATLSSRFDLIVVDSPPVLVAADAAILGAAADAVVFVVRAGQTRRDEARDALRQLAAVGARVVGAALNDPDMKVDDHAPAYAGYGYGYGVDAYAGQHV